MRPYVIAFIPAGVVFVAAEAVCRLLLGLSDQVVPLVVLPATIAVYFLARNYLIARRTRAGRNEP